MIRLPRRVLMWGGAAAVASAGFAFMASNSVAQSSAGEGSNTVTGYSASDIQYSVEEGWGQAAPTESVSTVKFLLVSAADAAPANGAPAQLVANLQINGVYPASPNLTCTGGTWTIGTAGDYAVANHYATVGQGWKSVTCNVVGGATPVAGVTGLDVEANQ